MYLFDKVFKNEDKGIVFSHRCAYRKEAFRGICASRRSRFLLAAFRRAPSSMLLDFF